mmetsp:Transcript_24771/g.37745  ORF Transcript_24771/g.37745 Transcript_24771/m.37745 type:complete len:329 (+) Transcript_24771:54-1040(+)
MAKQQSTFPYDVVAERGMFLASKVVTKEAGFDDLSHNSTLIRELEIDTGAKMGAGSTRKHLDGFTEEKPLGPMAIITNDHLSLHHSGLDSTGGWKEHYLHYGTKTKYGHVILAGTLPHFCKWAQSKACKDECAKVQKGRLFAYVHGYLLHVDAVGGFASGNIVNGKGFIVWASGNYYEGDIRNGKKHGVGRFTWASGQTYEGQLINGDFEGRGVFKYEDGGRYEGAVHKDKKHGHGHMVYGSGNEYDGSYVDGRKHGEGVFYNKKSGNRYEGQYFEDKKGGRGTFIWADGTRYVGEWVDDDMHGRGKKTRSDGTVIHDGMWNHDNPVQ